MAKNRKILCIGEILWDALPTGLFLGGAPLNVCYHLNQLGVTADICSRVGGDRLGKEALRRIQRNDMSTAHIQTDGQAETGFVEVEVTPDGEPTYMIIEPVAWDFIESTSSLTEAVKESWGIVFGSLAQRSKQSRDTIQKLCEQNVKKILDLNLRPPHIDKTVVRDSLNAADIIKMNEAELEQIKEWFSLSGDSNEVMEEIVINFDCSLVCVTRGANGAMLFKDGSYYEHKGFLIKAKEKDTVGAGDAFLAALLQGLQDKKDINEILTFANSVGAYVASFLGGTPEYTSDDIQEVINNYDTDNLMLE